MNPLRAVGQLLHWEPKVGLGPTYAGTCFAYRNAGYFITAAHCVGGLKYDHLAVKTPRGGLIKSALEVHLHETADVAVVRTATIHAEGDEVEPFQSIVGNWTLGEDFFAYGYPVDVLGHIASQPTERLFKGYFQRFVMHQSSHSPYRYLAGEMNFTCPAGLSGGPLFRPGAPSALLAVATENLRSTSVLEELESTHVGAETIEKRYERVIEYGVALMLSDVGTWVDSIVPGAPSGSNS